MIQRVFARLERRNDYFALGLWPVSVNALVRACARISTGPDVFVAVSHPNSPDGFHPPKPCEIQLWPKMGMGVVQTTWDTLADKVRDASLMRCLVDLLLYRPVLPPVDWKRLNAAFQSFAYGDALLTSGGYWTYMHDGEDLHFFVEPEMAAVSRVLQAMLFEMTEEGRRDCVDEMILRLSKLGDAEVLDVMFFGNRYQIKVAESVTWWDWEAVIPRLEQAKTQNE